MQFKQTSLSLCVLGGASAPARCYVGAQRMPDNAMGDSAPPIKWLAQRAT